MSCLILIGDDAQLPPVNMNASPALDSKYLAQQFDCSTQEALLTQVLRQSDKSGILKTATQIRNAIASNVFNTFEIHYPSNQIQHFFFFFHACAFFLKFKCKYKK